MSRKLVFREKFVTLERLKNYCNCKKRSFSKGMVNWLQNKLGMLDFPDVHEGKLECDSIQGEYRKCAVVSNTELCASIGRKVLEKGGSAVDAAIATLLCEGMCAMQNTGIGGGCFFTIYCRKDKTAACLDARESAPISATQNMFHGQYNKSAHGNLSVGVPGELMGYWEAHQKYGVLPWADLFKPAIDMCLNGVPINKRLAKSMSERGMGSEILDSPSMRKLLAEGGRLPQQGETLRLPALAQTLITVANSPKGALELYNGTLTSVFLRDLQSLGCLITAEDLQNYRAIWKEPVSTQLRGIHTLYSAPPPASGVILILILKLVEDVLGLDPARNMVALAEAFKYAYASRSMLGDPLFNDVTPIIEQIRCEKFIAERKEQIMNNSKTYQNPKDYGARFVAASDKGTINIVVLAPNGDAVAATSTINTLFGSMLASESTGIILNNEMDDFSAPKIINSFNLPPCPSNFIKGGKRPMSSSSPTVIVDENGDVRLVIGAAGGTYITTATAQVIINNLWYGLTIKEAVDIPRIHHQLYPMELKFEDGIKQPVLDHAIECGHKVVKRGPNSSVTAIAKSKGKITAIYDYRRGGSTDGF